MMYDLLALAYQANVSRVFTFMMAREVSNRTYPQVGVTDGHHATSHHQNARTRSRSWSRSRPITSGLFTKFLEKLNTTQDGDGSLLDHSLILYGSNMSNSNAHNHFPLPTSWWAAERAAEGRPAHQAARSHAHDQRAADHAGQGRCSRRSLGDSTGRRTTSKAPSEKSSSMRSMSLPDFLGAVALFRCARMPRYPPGRSRQGQTRRRSPRY